MVNLKPDGSFTLDQSYFKQHLHTFPNFYTDDFVKLLGIPKKKNEKGKDKRGKTNQTNNQTNKQINK